MIRLYNDYVILSDDLQWTLAKDTGRTRKDGRPMYDAVGYFCSLQNALEEFGRRNIRAALKSQDADLIQALAVMKEEDERLQKFIQDNIPDV